MVEQLDEERGFSERARKVVGNLSKWSHFPPPSAFELIPREGGEGEITDLIDAILLFFCEYYAIIVLPSLPRVRFFPATIYSSR